MKDNVNHPPHYTSHPSGVECIDITEHMNFNLGNAVKYIFRCGLKDGSTKLEDLEKARFYVSREIDRLQKTIEWPGGDAPLTNEQMSKWLRTYREKP